MEFRLKIQEAKPLTPQTNLKLIVKTTAEEAMAFSNSWRTYRERTDRLVRSRGKVYSLVLGQCTTVLLDKMKQDSDWQTVSDSYDPLKLLKLIETYMSSI